MLVRHQTRLTAFIAGYGHVSTVFPILVVSPAYLTGAITLGTLMQAHLAFQRVEGALAFCIQATLHGLSKRDAKERGEALIARVGLTNAADRRVGTYSGGMRRRLDLATALVHEPSVLFLDEPTTGLDPASRAAIWEEVRKLNDEGTTVFLTTQYLEEADQLADRVGIIDEGLMAAEGTPSELKAQVGKPRLELSLAEGSSDVCQERARPVRRAAAAQGRRGRRRAGGGCRRHRADHPRARRGRDRGAGPASRASPRSTTCSSRRRAATSREPTTGAEPEPA